MTQPPDTIEAALAEHLDRESDAPAWFRQTVERELKVGDRVRAVVSPECPLHATSERTVLNGLVGRIYDDLRSPRIGWLITDEEGAQRQMDHRHWWVVDFRGSGGAITAAGKLVTGDYFCAEELEPVEPAPEARPSGSAGEGEA